MQDHVKGKDMHLYKNLHFTHHCITMKVSTAETECKELQHKSRQLQDKLQAWQETVQEQRVLLEELREEMEQTEITLAAERKASDGLQKEIYGNATSPCMLPNDVNVCDGLVALQEELRLLKAGTEMQASRDLHKTEEVR